MPNGTSEVVKFELPDGSIQPFEIPAGLSDTDARSFVLSKRPDLFHSAAQPPPFLDAANQSKQQLLKSPASPNAFKPDVADLLRNAQAAGQVPQANPDLAKLAPAVGAGMGAGMVAKGGSGLLQLALKMAGAGAGGAAGDVAQQVAEKGSADPTQALKTGGGMAAGEGIGAGIISPFMKWLTSSKTVGAKLLQAASSKAGSASVELSPQTNETVDQIVQQGKLGGKIPKVISDLLERVGPSTRQAADANPGPLTYDEARILQSNASDSSVNEKLDLKGALRHLMPKFAKSFSQDVQAAADQAGAGSEHMLGMKEYAQAKARDTVLKNAAKYGAGTVGGGVAADILIRKLRK